MHIINKIYAARIWLLVEKEKRRLKEEEVSQRKTLIETISRNLVYSLAREKELLFCSPYEENVEVATKILDVMGVDYKTSARDGRWIIERRAQNDTETLNIEL